MVKICFILLQFFVLQSLAAPLHLTQKDVATMALNQSLHSKETAQKYAQLSSDAILARGVLEWKLRAQSGYQRDRTENLTLIGDYTFEQYTTSVDLSKSFLTGTTLTLDVSRVSQKTDYIPANTPIPYTQLTYDLATLSVEQPLYGNAFGRADRALIDKADLQLESDLLLRADELQNTVLSALRLYWTASVAQEQLKESLAARDRYEKLVGSVRKKYSYGYGVPGELSEVQAEYETQVQQVKQASVDYVKDLAQLITYLGLPEDTDIEFVHSKDLAPVPILTKVTAEGTRSVRSQKYRVDSLKKNVENLESRNGPALSFVGKGGTSGVDETSQGSWNDLNSTNHSIYYVGLRLDYQFGESNQPELVKQAQAQLNEETFKLERMQLEKQDQLVIAEKNVQTSRLIAESAERQLQYRDKAAQELTRTYTQGRTDISVLIDNINKLLTTEVQLLRAYGDYAIALNEWAAVRDELIPEEKLP